MKKATYLFVYGSLLKDQHNPMAEFLGLHSDFIGEGFFQGKLFQISWFPGAVLSYQISDRVYGHIFRLHNEAEVFAVLDDYEGIGEAYEEPQLFRKDSVKATLKNGEILQSWVYIYNLSVKGLEHIKSGNYLDYLKSK